MFVENCRREREQSSKEEEVGAKEPRRGRPNEPKQNQRCPTRRRSSRTNTRLPGGNNGSRRKRKYVFRELISERQKTRFYSSGFCEHTSSKKKKNKIFFFTCIHYFKYKIYSHMWQPCSRFATSANERTGRCGEAFG